MKPVGLVSVIAFIINSADRAARSAMLAQGRHDGFSPLNPLSSTLLSACSIRL
jgi:hypothetical protein